MITPALLALVPLGFAVGAYGTLIGAGGGFVLMPVLLLLYPQEAPERMTAISLAVVFLNALSGSAAYARLRRIDYRAGLTFAVATLPGAVAGSLVTELIPRQAFNLAMGTLLVLAGILLAVFPVRRPPAAVAAGGPGAARPGMVTRTLTDRGGERYVWSYSPALGIALSVLVGFLSSLLGIGGGIIHVPMMVNLLAFPVHLATATSHFILVFTALAGSITHFLQGDLLPGLPRVLFLGVGVLGGAQLGAFLSPRIHGPWIIRGLAMALALVGLRVLLG